jgi:hypothetical protein
MQRKLLCVAFFIIFLIISFAFADTLTPNLVAYSGTVPNALPMYYEGNYDNGPPWIIYPNDGGRPYFIFRASVGDISGSVKRPAIYELKEPLFLQCLLLLGLLPCAAGAGLLQNLNRDGFIIFWMMRVVEWPCIMGMRTTLPFLASTISLPTISSLPQSPPSQEHPA